LKRGELSVVIELSLEDTKKVLNNAIVITIAFSGHALADTFIFKHLLVRTHLVLPALIRMQDQTGMIRDLLKGASEHFGNLMKIRTS
jgi:hypothetical protein